MALVFYGMITAGMVCLVASHAPIRAILGMVGPGLLRRKWRGLSVLIVQFVFAFAGFGYLRLGAPLTVADFIVAFVLMTAGIFVLVVARLSLTTTKDFVRIAMLERDALHDPLTGVFNRRYLDIKLDEEIARARRSGEPLSALIIDLDHFKKINDSHGHPTGDLVLRHVCAVIVRQLRATDTVIRYGGEEFVVIVPASDVVAASQLGARVLRRLAEEPVVLPGGGSLPVTASIGASTLLAEDSAHQLLHRADAALYSAKRDGRNRLHIADDQQMSAAA
jgi:diguanylate cyclase (GGDEF)-like protein